MTLEHLDRAQEITRAHFANFTFGLSLFELYQEDLPEDAPIFFLEDVAGDEIGEPGMVALVAIANLPDPDEVNEAERGLLERRGWYQGGTWQYRLLLAPIG